MSVSAFLHVNIRCADVERTRAFYEFIGLTVGDRPPFASVGYWLYAGGAPVVHLVQRSSSETGHEASGNIDHVAFQGTDVDATRRALRNAGLPFREAVVPRDGTIQIFVRDPNGVQVELSFVSEKA